MILIKHGEQLRTEFLERLIAYNQQQKDMASLASWLGQERDKIIEAGGKPTEHPEFRAVALRHEAMYGEHCRECSALKNLRERAIIALKVDFAIEHQRLDFDNFPSEVGDLPLVYFSGAGSRV